MIDKRVSKDEIQKVIPESKAHELKHIIVSYAKENGLTMHNILDCMLEVKYYFCRNAILEKEDQEKPDPLPDMANQ